MGLPSVAVALTTLAIINVVLDGRLNFLRRRAAFEVAAFQARNTRDLGDMTDNMFLDRQVVVIRGNENILRFLREGQD